MDLSAYYEEHAELAKIVGRLRRLVDSGSVGSSVVSTAIFGELMQLSAKLTLHLGKEDLYLYPRLIRSTGPAKPLAETFQREMGGLKEAYGAFKGRWGSAKKIAAEPDAFARAAGGVLQALETRIKRENTELYQAAASV